MRCRDMIFNVEEFVSEMVFFAVSFFTNSFLTYFFGNGDVEEFEFFSLYMFFWKRFFCRI